MPAKENHLRLQIVIKKYHLFPLPFFPPTDHNKLSKSPAEHNVRNLSQKRKYTSLSPKNNNLKYPTNSTNSYLASFSVPSIFVSAVDIAVNRREKSEVASTEEGEEGYEVPMERKI